MLSKYTSKILIKHFPYKILHRDTICDSLYIELSEEDEFHKWTQL